MIFLPLRNSAIITRVGSDVTSPLLTSIVSYRAKFYRKMQHISLKCLYCVCSYTVSLASPRDLYILYCVAYYSDAVLLALVTLWPILCLTV